MKSVLPSRAVPHAATRRGLAAHWAVLGVAFTFAEAIVRLGHVAYQTLHGGLSPSQWLAFVALVSAFGYWEGERALRRRFAPAVVARALELEAHTAKRWQLLLAPLYAANLVGAPRDKLLRAWAAVFGIAAAVLIVRQLPAPWRGLVDGAVVVALSVGLVGLLSRFYVEPRR